MSHGLAHVQKRKKSVKGDNKFSGLSLRKKIMDKLAYVAAVSGPLLTLPQVIKIWAAGNAGGVSILTWGSYFIGSFFWLYYGILHNEKPIILTNLLWTVVNALVLIGAIMY